MHLPIKTFIALAFFFLPRRQGYLIVKPKLIRSSISTTQMSSSSSSTKEWDSVNGVWMGDKAISNDPLPSPLYLFGYGSLLWRPGDLLEDLPSYKSVSPGWQRLFAQRSYDHRGTSEFPGMVVTLIEAAYLLDNDNNNSNKQLSTSITDETTRNTKVCEEAYECTGLCWIIPEERVQKTLEILDFRERGGYSRHITRVKLQVQTPYHAAGDIVDAVVYSGSVDNPLFDFQRNRNKNAYPSSPSSSSTMSSSSSSSLSSSSSFRTRCRTADIIAAAVGPSGPNCDYLFNLRDYLSSNGGIDDDSYLRALAEDVALRMGPWRGLRPTSKHIPSYTDPRHNTSIVPPTPAASEQGLSLASLPSSSSSVPPSPSLPPSPFLKSSSPPNFHGLLGWGSHEFLQLGTYTNIVDLTRGLQPTATPVKVFATASSSSPKNHHYPNRRMALPSPSSHPLGRINPPLQTTHCNQVVCGGGTSAYLDVSGKLFLWGKLSSLLKNVSKDTSMVETEGVVVMEGVEGVAIGHDHLLLLRSSGWVDYMGEGDGSIGDSSDASGNGPNQSNTQPSTTASSSTTTTIPSSVRRYSVDDCSQKTTSFHSSPSQILKISAGVRHSAAISTDGRLFVWGAGAAGRLSKESDDRGDGGEAGKERGGEREGREGDGLSWRPPDGALLIDVSCGMHMTIVVDDRGRIWSFGDNKYDCLGRDIPIQNDSLRPTNDVPLHLHSTDHIMTNDNHVSTMKSSKTTRIRTTKSLQDSVPRLVSINHHDGMADDDVNHDKPKNLGDAQEPGLGQIHAQEPGLGQNIRWQRVSCGWSHTVARGIRPDGSLVFVAWGRRDMGQYPVDTMNPSMISSTITSSSSASSLGCSSLSKLPGNRCIREIWAGSEYTIAADMDGGLWSCGWNEHGNLGRMEIDGILGNEMGSYDTAYDWVPVMRRKEQKSTKDVTTSSLDFSTTAITITTTDTTIIVDTTTKTSVMTSEYDPITKNTSPSDYEQVKLHVVWEGALSCGGGHCLCLTCDD